MVKGTKQPAKRRKVSPPTHATPPEPLERPTVFCAFELGTYRSSCAAAASGGRAEVFYTLSVVSGEEAPQGHTRVNFKAPRTTACSTMANMPPQRAGSQFYGGGKAALAVDPNRVPESAMFDSLNSISKVNFLEERVVHTLTAAELPGHEYQIKQWTIGGRANCMYTAPQIVANNVLTMCLQLLEERRDLITQAGALVCALTVPVKWNLRTRFDYSELARIVFDTVFSTEVAIVLVTEPVAAAAAILKDRQINRKRLPRYLLVIDFGAGTIDVALVELEAEGAAPGGAGGAGGAAPSLPPINGKVLLTDGIVHGAGGNAMTGCMQAMVQKKLEKMGQPPLLYSASYAQRFKEGLSLFWDEPEISIVETMTHAGDEVSMVFTREEVVTAAAAPLGLITQLLRRVQGSAEWRGLPTESVLVALVGGGGRFPPVVDAVRDVFGADRRVSDIESHADAVPRGGVLCVSNQVNLVPCSPSELCLTTAVPVSDFATQLSCMGFEEDEAKTVESVRRCLTDRGLSYSVHGTDYVELPDVPLVRRNTLLPFPPEGFFRCENTFGAVSEAGGGETTFFVVDRQFFEPGDFSPHDIVFKSTVPATQKIQFGFKMDTDLRMYREPLENDAEPQRGDAGLAAGAGAGAGAGPSGTAPPPAPLPAGPRSVPAAILRDPCLGDLLLLKFLVDQARMKGVLPGSLDHTGAVDATIKWFATWHFMRRRADLEAELGRVGRLPSPPLA